MFMGVDCSNPDLGSANQLPFVYTTVWLAEAGSVDEFSLADAYKDCWAV